MSIIETANTQQVLQMGSHTEKLQQTIQNQASIISKQLQDEQVKQVELQNFEVQEPESKHPSAFNPDGKGQKGLLFFRPKSYSSLSTKDNKSEIILRALENFVGEKINIVV